MKGNNPFCHGANLLLTLHMIQETLKAKGEAYNELRAGACVKQPCAC